MVFCRHWLYRVLIECVVAFLWSPDSPFSPVSPFWPLTSDLCLSLGIFLFWDPSMYLCKCYRQLHHHKNPNKSAVCERLKYHAMFKITPIPFLSYSVAPFEVQRVIFATHPPKCTNIQPCNWLISCVNKQFSISLKWPDSINIRAKVFFLRSWIHIMHEISMTATQTHYLWMYIKE